MASATADKTADRAADKKAAALGDLLLLLGDGEAAADDVLARAGEGPLSLAWVKGYVEFGRTKYSVTGNPESPASEPCLVVEGGLEWGGPKTARHGRLKDVLAFTPPVCQKYQRYQREVLVNREKDAWEWVDGPDDVKGRETRWARRASDRREAEAALRLFVRLTDAGVAALQAD